MRIVIDLQGAQSISRNRGIGRLSLSLAQAIARNRGEHEVFLALNGSFPDAIESIRSAFRELLPQENIRVWHAPGPLAQNTAANTWRRKSAELIRETFLASLNPTVVIVMSLFEGLGDDTVTSIGSIPSHHYTAVLLHDLIPLIHRQRYLTHPISELWYEEKLGFLRRADILLCNSDSTRNEGIQYAGFKETETFSVYAGKDDHFAPTIIEPERESKLREKYNLTAPFIMYGSGLDFRKNNEALIRAYSRLPAAIRQTHQLAIVCSIQPEERSGLETFAKNQGLTENELILTGYVPEEDLIALYNLCKIFVFPSWHEGFGLPVLEAMACGKAVIGANTSSLPEVIGYEAALFDPFDDASITSKLEQALSDDVFRQTLEQHALEQAKKFSWDKSARLALDALELFIARAEKPSKAPPCKLPRRPRLAYVSPLPPERSGISDYSAELLPELARYYDIEVVLAQDSVSTPWINANCPIRTVDWFRNNLSSFDRVLYQFGNSHFHQHMFSLLEAVPGVVVLHDFFLSGIAKFMANLNATPESWISAFYSEHGYEALQFSDPEDAMWHYPCNLSVLQNAQGIIVHSDYSCKLARQWYGESAVRNWTNIPHLRMPVTINSHIRNSARAALGLGEHDFVVCSFGFLTLAKLNHRLLNAWLASPLAVDEECVLVFVGQESDEYGQALLDTIKQSNFAPRIRITGWVDSTVYHQYLEAADVGVQLRTLSRGETSGTVLDCMNYGLATIVNANGSMADLPDNGVLKLPDEFTDKQLIEALSTLWRRADRRHELGKCAKQIIRSQHAPRSCAEQFYSAIERFQQSYTPSVPSLIQSIAGIESAPSEPNAWLELAKAIDQSIPAPLTQRQLLIDISAIVHGHAENDLQHVISNLIRVWLQHPPDGYRVEPVYSDLEHPGFFYARRFTLEFLGHPSIALSDEPISYRNGDIFVGIGFQPKVGVAHGDFYQVMRREGVSVQFIVHDMLPLQMPNSFPDGAATHFEDWLKTITQTDGAVCASRTVADELANWLKTHPPKSEHPFQINRFCLGIAIQPSVPTTELPEDASSVIESLVGKPSFLMIGTIEPRKGYAQALEAFEILWAQEKNVTLVIVGKPGRHAEELVKKLQTHSELGKRLFWLEGISNEYLERIYAVATCLIAASEGEGFGSPLIEAAQRQLPIIARNIPIFHEVAGEHATYFDNNHSNELAQCIIQWLQEYANNKYPISTKIPWVTWEESANQLFTSLTYNPCK